MAKGKRGRRRNARREPRPAAPRRRWLRALLGGLAGTLGALALFFVASTLFYGAALWTEGGKWFWCVPRGLWGPREDSVVGAYLVIAVTLPVGWVCFMGWLARVALRRPWRKRLAWLAVGATLVAAYFWAYAAAWFMVLRH